MPHSQASVGRTAKINATNSSKGLEKSRPTTTTTKSAVRGRPTTAASAHSVHGPSRPLSVSAKQRGGGETSAGINTTPKSPRSPREAITPETAADAKSNGDLPTNGVSDELNWTISLPEPNTGKDNEDADREENKLQETRDVQTFQRVFNFCHVLTFLGIF